MEFKKLQKSIIKNAKRYSKKHKIKFDDNFAMIKLYEEMGELSEAFLTYKKKSRTEKYISAREAKRGVAKEMADVVGLAVVMSDILKINLEEAIIKNGSLKNG
ncbi:MAG: hypothetical protein AAB487_03505 [Patescibacteria group bacterium]